MTDRGAIGFRAFAGTLNRVGLFGMLHAEFGACRKAAFQMAP